MDKEFEELPKALGSSCDLMQYVEDRTEIEVAFCERRPSLVSGHELAKLGAIAFTGYAADRARTVIDGEIRVAVNTFLNASGAPLPVDEHQRAWNAHNTEWEKLFGKAGPSMKHYVSEYIKRVVERGTRSSEDASTRSGEVDRVPLYDGDVWDLGAKYSRGTCVTFGGTMWVCRADHTSDKPGTNSSWRLMAKSADSMRESSRRRHGAAA